MGYRIDIDDGHCINCGICMDVCPVEALDMTRPLAAGIEAGPTGGPLSWMMERPVQVGECIGCGICVRECPVVVMSLATVTGPTPLADRRAHQPACRRRARLGASLGPDARSAQTGPSVAVGWTVRMADR